jgi:hypothetical protein
LLAIDAKSIARNELTVTLSTQPLISIGVSNANLWIT